MITDAQVAEATTAADEAEATLAQAEQAVLDSRHTPDATAMASLAGLGVKARLARARAGGLAAQRNQQTADLEARAGREHAAAPAVTDLQRQLEESRSRLCTAVGKAEKATAAALAAAEEHDAAVAAAKLQLAELGLRLDDVDRLVDHATGAAPTSDPRGGVRINGQAWGPVSAPALLHWIAARTARSWWGTAELVSARLGRLPGVAEMGQRADGLLEDVPALPARRVPARKAPRPDYGPRAEAGLAPSLKRAELAALAAKPEPAPGWAEAFRAEYGIDPGGDAA